MTATDPCTSLLQGTLVLPVPRYPSHLVTDESLKIAANQTETALTMRAASGDTIFRVSDTSRLVVNMLLTIDSEIVSVSAIDAATHTITVVRGFDGTVAVPHNPGRLLRAYIDAWHHNALAAEVKAIEQALGPNLSNITGSEAVNTRTYAWVAQPGGSLTVGNNVITLAPVPMGVNGTNQNHYVWVSGGTGAAEACLITGGTAVSGAASGTLIIQCANAHSGSWSVGTATAGIQEAVHVAGNSGQPIRIPEGDSVIHAATTVPYSNVAILGNGMGLTQVVGLGMSSQNAFTFAGGGLMEKNVLADLSVIGEAAQTGGWAVEVSNQIFFKCERLLTLNWPNGIWLNSANIAQLSDINIYDVELGSGVGVQIEGPQSFIGRLDRVLVTCASLPAPSSMAGLRVRQCQDTIVNDSHFLWCNIGLLADPGPGQVVSSLQCVSCYFDQSRADGVRFIPAAGGSIVRSGFSGCWSSDSKLGAGISITDSAGGDVDGVSVVNTQIYHNASNGLFVDGGNGRVKNIRVSGSVMAGNSYTSPGTASGAIFNASDWMFSGNRCGPVDGWASSQSFGLVVFGVGSDNFIVTGNDLHGNMTAGLQNNGRGLSQVVRNNLGESDLVITIASAATIDLGMTAAVMVRITGTVPIANILNGWHGRVIQLIFTDASPGGVAAGGNIARTQAAVRYQSIQLTWDGTAAGWY